MSLQIEASSASLARARHWVAARALNAGVPDHDLPLLTLLSYEVITNAILHGPTHGLVTIRALRRDGQAGSVPGPRDTQLVAADLGAGLRVVAAVVAGIRRHPHLPMRENACDEKSSPGLAVRALYGAPITRRPLRGRWMPRGVWVE